MSKNYKKIGLAILLIALILGVIYFVFPKTSDAPTSSESGYERYRPKDPIVYFYVEPDSYNDVQIGEELESSLYMDTKGEDVYSLAATHRYYAPRVELMEYVVNPAYRDFITVDDTEIPYVKIKSTEFDKPLNGDKIKLLSIRVKTTSKGNGFFDTVNGDLEAMNKEGENIADIYNVKRVAYKVVEEVEE